MFGGCLPTWCVGCMGRAGPPALAHGLHACTCMRWYVHDGAKRWCDWQETGNANKIKSGRCRNSIWKCSVFLGIPHETGTCLHLHMVLCPWQPHFDHKVYVYKSNFHPPLWTYFQANFPMQFWGRHRFRVKNHAMYMLDWSWSMCRAVHICACGLGGIE